LRASIFEQRILPAICAPGHADAWPVFPPKETKRVEPATDNEPAATGSAVVVVDPRQAAVSVSPPLAMAAVDDVAVRCIVPARVESPSYWAITSVPVCVSVRVPCPPSVTYSLIT
jgi:hypothetical protein